MVGVMFCFNFVAIIAQVLNYCTILSLCFVICSLLVFYPENPTNIILVIEKIKQKLL